MGQLVAVYGDKNEHIEGALKCTNNPGKVFVQGKLVAMKDCEAEPDLLGHVPTDVNPNTASTKVFVCGIPVHRNLDMRYCTAKTLVTNQTKVFAG